MLKLRYLCIPLLALLAACDKPAPKPGMKIGKPYEINGKTYYPEYDPHYDKTGMGSWYGPGFHGKKTANGERFNQNDITAAHPTLPMPSMVRVTNIANGKSIIVRINDRGPFKKGRIIDLSKASAEAIGMHSTMMVRVQYLPEETEEYLQSLQPPGTTFVLPDKYKGRAVQQTTEQSAPAAIVTSTDIAPPPAAKKGGAVTLVGTEEPADELSEPTVLVQKDPAKARVSPFLPPEPKRALQPEMEVPAIVKTTTKTKGTYFVQVGTFSKKENAERIAQKVSGAKVTAAGKAWRVRSGPYQTKEDADAAAIKARSAGAKDATVTK